MRLVAWLGSSAVRLDIVAGVVDGVLTALTLTAAKMLDAGESVGIDLALRVSAAAGLTTVFVFFLAHYAQLRSGLMHAERQLNVLRRGRLAQSDLGHRILNESLAGAALAATCSMFGAFIPMLITIVAPGPSWVGCAIAIAILGGLGVVLAKSFHGSAAGWAAALMIAGAALTFVGAELRITQ